jgi:hypothetical protein
MKKHIICKIKNNNAIIKCLCLKYTKIIPSYKIIDYIPIEDYSIYQNVLKRLKNIYNCPICNVEFYNKHRNIKIYCHNCQNDVCMICEKKDHINICKPISLNIWGAHQCPNCNLTVIKDGGCNHMTCTWCKYQYDYNTKQSWDEVIKQRRKEAELRELRERQVREAKELREKQVRRFREIQKRLKQELKEKQRLRRKEKFNAFKEKIVNLFTF